MFKKCSLDILYNIRICFFWKKRMTLQIFKTNSDINCKLQIFLDLSSVVVKKLPVDSKNSSNRWHIAGFLVLYFYISSCIRNKYEIVTKKFKNKCYTTKTNAWLKNRTKDSGVISFLLFSWAFLYKFVTDVVKHIPNCVKTVPGESSKFSPNQKYKFIGLIW